MRDPQRFCPVLNTPEVTRLLVTDYAGDTATVHLCDFIHTGGQSDFKRTAVRIRIRLQDGWRKALREAGFTAVEFFGDWDSTPYDKQSSRRLIGVAQK